MKDYYSLAAFFRNTTQGPKDGNAKDGRGPVLILPDEADRERWNALPDEIASATKSRDERRRIARQDIQAMALACDGRFTSAAASGGRIALARADE